jgi:hypothetical protein
MKKFLFIFILGILSLGVFAEDNPKKLTTVKVETLARVTFQKDSVLSVETFDPNVCFVIKDSVLTIKYNGYTPCEDTVKILIKTPQKLNVVTSRYFKIRY